MKPPTRDNLQKLWLTLIGLYAAIFLAAYTLGLSVTPLNPDQLKSLCTSPSSSSLYGVVMYVIPLAGQAFFSGSAAVEGVCIGYLYKDFGAIYIGVEYFYMAMLALLIAVPSADSVILTSLLILYLSYRKVSDEVLRDKLRAMLRGGLITYVQHAVLTVVVLLLVIFALRFF